MDFNWNERFSQQARWTKSVREYLLSTIHIDPLTHILEVGCGTGAVLNDVAHDHQCFVHGLDVNQSFCEFATRSYQNLFISNSDAHSIPYPTGFFDVVFCHYFLLWLTDAQEVMIEIKRVLKPGGRFFAFAEPDYGARIDHPSPFIRLGKLQTRSLVDQGINPIIGRLLPDLAINTGFEDCRYGVSGYETHSGNLPDWWESEWQTLRFDLENLIDQSELNQLQAYDHQCWLDGNRVLWVPTFYLSCIKPQ